MPAMNQEIQLMKEIIGSETLGVFWITPTPLSTHPKYFFALDYFMDGLLNQYVNQMQRKEAVNYFISKSFGSFFFLGHLQSDNFNLNIERIKQLLALLPKNTPAEKKQILLLDPYHNHLIKFLRKDFEQFDFFEWGFKE